MLLRLEQLSSHLQKTLAPVYLISGDVPLLVQEAADAVRTKAQQSGFTERQLYYAATGFSWQDFLNGANTGSLFSDKQLLELRVTGSLGDAGSKGLQAYLAKPPPDKILLLITNKIDAQAQRSVWFQNISKAAVVVQIWPLEKNQLANWISQRLAKSQLTAEKEGIQILVDCAEGNLLAAAQEIEKLRLIYGAGELTAQAIADAVSDNARFDVFALSDAVLMGDGKRIIRIFENLKDEGTEPTLILWALAREIRNLALLADKVAQRIPLEIALQEQQVWEKRKPMIRQALQKHSANTLRKLLQQASVIDGIIKGNTIGNYWDELRNLALEISALQIKCRVD